jgi:hypothetical protein
MSDRWIDLRLREEVIVARDRETGIVEREYGVAYF